MKDLEYSSNTSITVVQGCLIVTLPNEMSDEEIEIGTSKIIMRANSSSIIGTIFDLSMISSLDSYSFKALKNTSKTIALMGVMVVWIGLKPGVICALLDLDVDFSGIQTAFNLEQGLKLISDAKRNKISGTR